MITGYASAESVIAALSAGASDYLTKPFEDLKVVQAKVRAALGRRHEQLLFRERAHEVAREAAALLEQGKDAPEPEWKKLEQQLGEYEKAIQAGGGGRVRVVGDPEVLSVLLAAGIDAQPSVPTGPELKDADVVVLETNTPEWRAIAERLAGRAPGRDPRRPARRRPRRAARGDHPQAPPRRVRRPAGEPARGGGGRAPAQARRTLAGGARDRAREVPREARRVARVP